MAQILCAGYIGNNKGLADVLHKSFLHKLGLIYQVFICKDGEDRADLVEHFLFNLDYNEMQSLVKGNSFKKNNEGWFLGKWMIKWLNKSSRPPTLTLVMFSRLINKTERVWNLYCEPRRLSEAEIDEYKEKPGGNNFKEDIIWELPIECPGYVVYNRNDEAIDGLDQIGTHKTITAIKAIAGIWNQSNPNRSIQIGDLSRPGGLDTSQHKGHEDGKIFDMRPLRNDGLTGVGAQLTYNSPSYSQDLTKKFIKLVKQLYPNVYILFNDPDIAGQDEFTYVHSDNSGIHDNHLHIEFR